MKHLQKGMHQLYGLHTTFKYSQKTQQRKFLIILCIIGHVVYSYIVCIHTLLQGLEVMEVTSAYQCCQVWL